MAQTTQDAGKNYRPLWLSCTMTHKKQGMALLYYDTQETRLLREVAVELAGDLTPADPPTNPCTCTTNSQELLHDSAREMTK